MPSEGRQESAERTKKLVRLEFTRKLLFDDEFCRQWAQEKIASMKKASQQIGFDASGAIEAEIDRQTGLINGSTRATIALNNLYSYLPGGVRSKMDDPHISKGWAGRTPVDFSRDFLEAASHHNIDADKVREMNSKIQNGINLEGLLGLYRYVYPAIEELVKEKDYPDFY
jgi:hypothetical protein